MNLGLSVCLSVCPDAYLKKHIAPIRLIFYTIIIIPGILIWTEIFILRILHHWEIGRNMPSKYATASNMRYDENMRYDVTYASSERVLSFLIALL